MTIRKIEAGRVITKNIDNFVGQAGTIFYDEQTGELRLSDGVTPGGTPIGGSGGGGNGYTGSRGSTGTQGAVGYTGSVGYSGSVGYTGSRGSTGTQGSVGYTGSTGSTGTQGVIGYTGSQGVIGYTGSTGTQGVTGYTGSQGPQGVSNNIFYYNADTNTNSGYPGDGNLLWDNTVQTSSTNIIVSHLSSDAVDIDIYLSLIQKTQQFIIQDRDNSGNYQTWYVSDAPINTNTGTTSSYWTIPVTLIDSRGVGDTPGFIDNHSLILGLISGTKGDIGYTGSAGSDGSIGYTGSTGYTGSSSNITISEINAASSLTNTVTNVTAIRFDKDTGFSVTDLGSGEVKISLGSSFKTWKVDGQQDLIAVGEDTIRLVAGNGVILTTDPNAAIKTLTISSEGGTGSGSSVIKTFNILNEFTAPLLGKSIYIPDSSTTIRSVQLVNGMGAVGMDLMVGLYRNNELLNFFTIPAGNIAKKYADLNYFITSSDYITVNVVSGQGGNFSMVLFNA